MNYLHDLESGKGDIINVVVEIPRGSRNKYEYSKKEGVFKLDRVLFSSVFYPTDYGFIPQTWYEDEDPLDAMVLVRLPTFTGCVIKSRIIGMLRMEDDKGIDDKILAVPVDDPYFEDVKSLDDLPESLLNEIAHFFKRYKELEKKEVKIHGWLGKEEALKALEHARELYKQKF